MEWKDARLLSASPFIPHEFAALDKSHRLLPDTTEANYATVLERLRRAEDVIIQRITYRVDGFAVSGAALFPRKVRPGAHPILIYNRGGSGDYGYLTAWNMYRLSHYAREGYLVFATNYRGNDGGEGKEEFGGADVNDVLTLLDMARSHPGWDGKNSFMYGHSRGGMMTYLAIKQGAVLNAAVSIAGPAAPDQAEERPDMLTIYRRFIPQFDDNPQAALEQRSAVCWADMLNVPLLLLHGDADWRVDVSHTRKLDEALTAACNPHRAVIYPGGDHSLMAFRNETRDEIDKWFARYKV